MESVDTLSKVWRNIGGSAYLHTSASQNMSTQKKFILSILHVLIISDGEALRELQKVIKCQYEELIVNQRLRQKAIQIMIEEINTLQDNDILTRKDFLNLFKKTKYPNINKENQVFQKTKTAIAHTYFKDSITVKELSKKLNLRRNLHYPAKVKNFQELPMFSQYLPK